MKKSIRVVLSVISIVLCVSRADALRVINNSGAPITILRIDTRVPEDGVVAMLNEVRDAASKGGMIIKDGEGSSIANIEYYDSAFDPSLRTLIHPITEYSFLGFEVEYKGKRYNFAKKVPDKGKNEGLNKKIARNKVAVVFKVPSDKTPTDKRKIGEYYFNHTKYTTGELNVRFEPPQQLRVRECKCIYVDLP